MQIKKSGGKIFGAILTAAEKKAMDMEINRQIVESDRKYQDNLDAIILWGLHKEFGFGLKRLRRAYRMLAFWHKVLRDYYEMPDDDGFLCMVKLKEYGCDIEKWKQEEGN